MPGLASSGRVSAFAVVWWSPKKIKLAFQGPMYKRDMKETILRAKVNQTNKTFDSNFKVDKGYEEDSIYSLRCSGRG